MSISKKEASLKVLASVISSKPSTLQNLQLDRIIGWIFWPLRFIAHSRISNIFLGVMNLLHDRTKFCWVWNVLLPIFEVDNFLPPFHPDCKIGNRKFGTEFWKEITPTHLTTRAIRHDFKIFGIFSPTESSVEFFISYHCSGLNLNMIRCLVVRRLSKLSNILQL